MAKKDQERKKKKKKMGNKPFVGIWSVVMAITLILLLVVNVASNANAAILDQYVGYGDLVVKRAPGTEDWDANYYPTSEGVNTPDDAVAFAKDATEEICEDSSILLKNTQNTLPMTSGMHVTLLGRDSVDPFYGGTGSGGTAGAEFITPQQGLESAGFVINPSANQFFMDHYQDYDRSIMDYTSGLIDKSTYFIGEINPESYDFDIDGYNDAALVFIGRGGGEGLDLSTDLVKSAETSASQSAIESHQGTADEVSTYEAGQHQLELDQYEKEMLDYAKSNFDKVVVIVNTSNAMELGEIQDDSDVDAILWVGSPGCTGFNALGKTLNGEVNPSGRTVDTYPYDMTKDPSFMNMGVYQYKDVDESTVASGSAMFYGQGDAYMVQYEEGIYVGYRYYETADAEAKAGNYEGFDYDSAVVYPFGYGLSYTSFDQELVSHQVTEGKIQAQVKVTNTGDVSGKEVVQLYYHAPYEKGDIEKSEVVLGDFSKTQVLEPGQSETLTLEIPIEDMASYDYKTEKAYVLDAGAYTISLRQNSHEVIDQFDYDQAQRVVYNADEGGRISDDQVATNQFDNVSSMFTDTPTENYALNFSRADFAGTYPTTPLESELISADMILGDGTSVKDGLAIYDPEQLINGEDVAPIMGQDNGLFLIDLRGVDYEDPLWDDLLDELPLSAYSSDTLCNGAYNTPMIEEIGKPKTIDKDGPAGITSQTATVTGQSTCAYMSETTLGASFNKDMAYLMGEAIGNECLEFGVTGWYAPAVDTHRSAFAGRNFEYYSEDGRLSGDMVTRVIEGAADKGVNSYLKHFALNDMENNRTASLCVWANEQAIREIYLKAFEIPVKNAKTTIRYITDDQGTVGEKTIQACQAMMSSFNRIGTTWAGGNPALLKEVLRNEWGFRGSVITDFNIYDMMDPIQGMTSGSDIQLTYTSMKQFGPLGDTPSIQLYMRQALKNILYTTVNSNAVNQLPPQGTFERTRAPWQTLVMIISIVLVILFLLELFFVIRRVKRHKENA